MGRTVTVWLSFAVGYSRAKRRRDGGYIGLRLRLGDSGLATPHGLEDSFTPIAQRVAHFVG